MVWLNKVKSLNCFCFDYFIFMVKHKICLEVEIVRSSDSLEITTTLWLVFPRLTRSLSWCVKPFAFCMRFHLWYSWIVYFKFHIACFTGSIRMLCRLNPPVIFFSLFLVFTFVLNFVHFAENNNKNQVIKLSCKLPKYISRHQ